MEFWGEIWSLLRADYEKEYNINRAIIKLILGLIMNLFDISSLIPLKKFKKNQDKASIWMLMQWVVWTDLLNSK